MGLTLLVHPTGTFPHNELVKKMTGRKEEKRIHSTTLRNTKKNINQKKKHRISPWKSPYSSLVHHKSETIMQC